MAKRKNQKWLQQRAKRTRISSVESDQRTPNLNLEEPNDFNLAGSSTNPDNWIQVKQDDVVENKVNIIITDADNKNYRSLTICGIGLGVEKTIAVVETLKRHYLKEGTNYSQETSIKTGENDEPELQVILTLLGNDIEQTQEVVVQT